MPIFKIHHITRYEYDREVHESVNEVRIFPYADEGQDLVEHDLTITASPAVFSFKDWWGNKAGNFTLYNRHKELVIDSRLTVRTLDRLLPYVNGEHDFASLPKSIGSDLQMLQLIQPEIIQESDAVEEIITQVNDGLASVAKVVEACSTYIFTQFSYVPGITTVETGVDEILQNRSGVCQDFAHVMLQVLRSLGIPCRYVSGYICPNKNGLRGEGATHAWVEAWIPGHGWAGIDPTNRVWVTNSHVKLAVGRNFNDCSPVKGTFKGGARQNLSVYVSVGYEDGGVFGETNDVKVPNQTRFSLEQVAAAQQQ